MSTKNRQQRMEQKLQELREREESLAEAHSQGTLDDRAYDFEMYGIGISESIIRHS